MSDNINNDNNDVKLYAGKFKTVEDLEAGYNNAAKVYQENEELRKKHDDATKVPDEYLVSADINLHDNDLVQLKIEAKQSGLNQAQFDKLAANRNKYVQSKSDSLEQAKAEIGTDNLNMLQDFINKSYSPKVAEKMLREAIRDKDLRGEIMDARTKALNSSVPGSSNVSISNYNAVTHKDVMKAREEMLGARGKARVEAQKRYVALSSKLAHSND